MRPYVVKKLLVGLQREYQTNQAFKDEKEKEKYETGKSGNYHERASAEQQNG